MPKRMALECWRLFLSKDVSLGIVNLTDVKKSSCMKTGADGVWYLVCINTVSGCGCPPLLLSARSQQKHHSEPVPPGSRTDGFWLILGKRCLDLRQPGISLRPDNVGIRSQWSSDSGDPPPPKKKISPISSMLNSFGMPTVTPSSGHDDELPAAAAPSRSDEKPPPPARPFPAGMQVESFESGPATTSSTMAASKTERARTPGVSCEEGRGKQGAFGDCRWLAPNVAHMLLAGTSTGGESDTGFLYGVSEDRPLPSSMVSKSGV